MPAHILNQFLRNTLLAALMLSLSGCGLLVTREAGIGEKLSWSELPGWEQDTHAMAWPALVSQCSKLPKGDEHWERICTAASALSEPTDQQAKGFFETHFVPHAVIGKDGSAEGLITGYYEPLLHGNTRPDERYAFPLYARPDSLLVVDLDELFPELKGKRVRGLLKGNRVVPFYDRAAIDGGAKPLQGKELLWVDDPYAAFFLQVQGSGRVNLPDGSTVKVGYADQNGHQYVSIGKTLIEQGELKREDVSLFTINQWLRDNPDKAQELLNQNPSYVFFHMTEDDGTGPRGSLNVPLTAERSAAVDRSVIPLGTPIWLNTDLPTNGETYQRLLFAQDTGGAIKGPVRADVFFGQGQRAEQLAGTMKQSGRLYALLPRE
jgi:membrane-bound lytic murein transglycosylase A